MLSYKGNKIILSLMLTTLLIVNGQLALAITTTTDITTPGIEYKSIITKNKQILHVIEINPKLYSIKPVRAMDIQHSRENVVNIAKHYNAIAAINGGFFRINEKGDGLPSGLLKINHRLYGIAYNARAAIGWSNKNNITLLDRIQTKTTLDLKQNVLTINGMNIPLTDKRAILYSDSYEDRQLHFTENATHFVIKGKKIHDIQTQNDIAIPKNGYVYSVGNKLTNNLPKIAPGDSIKINAQLIPVIATSTAMIWNSLPYVLSGAPLLLKDGIKIENYTDEKLSDGFLNKQYARTVIGILKNGNWLLVVTESNPVNHIAGFTISELATAMQDLGCTDAINLDGGGSSTMYFDNKIINFSKYDSEDALNITTLRKVSDAILVLKKTKFD